MPSASYRQIIDTFFGQSPYADFDASGGSATPQGWGQHNPIFEKLIHEIRPRLIIEVGTWLGASAIRMADLLAERNIAATIVCVDTWLGSAIHWRDATYRRQLALQNGYPRLYQSFLANVVAAGRQDTILPMPQTSENAAQMIGSLGLTAELIYIDGDHEGTAVYADLMNYWPLLTPGGVMFGDDFVAEWPGVVNAVKLFANKVGVQPELLGEKWIIRKP